jgi:Ca-activated chloride channel family protein
MRLLAVLVVGFSLVAACSSSDEGGEGEDAAPEDEFDLGDPGDCIIVDMALSPEKIDLVTELAREFNQSDAEVDGECVFIRPQRKSSGAAMQLLAQGWPEDIVEAEGPRPVVWSPAASTWGPVLNERLATDGEEPMANEGTPFMLTPLVIAMPQPMAEALGWPDEPLGWADILELAQTDQAWAANGHPEWGEFRLGKTNPNFSTSGLAALIAQSYAATGKTSDLSLEDLANPAVTQFATDIESAVTHYGDTTLTFLNNWYEADKRGTALTYTSAAAVEEKSVIDYNRGNPDGVLDAGEEPRPPKEPLVAIYPEEGTLFSDNPFYILDAEWVNDDQRAGAELFEEFVQQPENQEKVLEFGFRPGNRDVEIGKPIVAENGVDPDQPQTLLEVPSSAVMAQLLESWDSYRKGARVLIVVDVSGSMSEAASEDSNATKLELAKEAAVEALDAFKDDDLVGLRIFSTSLGPDGTDYWEDLLPVARLADQRDDLAREIEGLVPVDYTPLYDTTTASYEQMVDQYDPERINAIILLSDGVNQLDNQPDPQEGLQEMLDALAPGEGQNDTPVRIFPIAYGSDADLDVLQEIASATRAKAYDATDPLTINKVFAEVVSNF